MAMSEDEAMELMTYWNGHTGNMSSTAGLSVRVTSAAPSSAQAMPGKAEHPQPSSMTRAETRTSRAAPPPELISDLAKAGPACHTSAPVPILPTEEAPGCETETAKGPSIKVMLSSPLPLRSVVHKVAGSPSVEKSSIMLAPRLGDVRDHVF